MNDSEAACKLILAHTMDTAGTGPGVVVNQAMRHLWPDNSCFQDVEVMARILLPWKGSSVSLVGLTDE